MPRVKYYVLQAYRMPNARDFYSLMYQILYSCHLNSKSTSTEEFRGIVRDERKADSRKENGRKLDFIVYI